MSTTHTILDNPQLVTIEDLGAHPARLALTRTCVACGVPIARGANFNVIFSGYRSSPTAFAAAHEDPPPGTSWPRDDDDWPINPCLAILERIYWSILDAAGILRCVDTGSGLDLHRFGGSAEIRRDLSGDGQAGTVLLASGHWAAAHFTPGTPQPLQLELRPSLLSAGAPSPRRGPQDPINLSDYVVMAPLPAGTLFRVGRNWELHNERPFDDGGTTGTRLVPGVDSGGPTWFLDGEALSAGTHLDVYVPIAGWSLGRLETTHGGKGANIHVGLANGHQVVIPAHDVEVRRFVAGRGRGGSRS